MLTQVPRDNRTPILRTIRAARRIGATLGAFFIRNTLTQHRTYTLSNVASMYTFGASQGSQSNKVRW